MAPLEIKKYPRMEIPFRSIQNKESEGKKKKKGQEKEATAQTKQRKSTNDLTSWPSWLLKKATCYMW